MCNLRGVKFNVGDSGFVKLVDYMGSDERICEVARTSYQAGTKRASDDKALIRRLMRDRHTSPFEHAVVTLHVRSPIHVWRQWVRHRTQSINEWSTRYSLACDEVEAIAPGDWRIQSLTNKQGSSNEKLPYRQGAGLSQKQLDLFDAIDKFYKYALEQGVSREQARNVLPLANYTEATTTINLHNLLHFLQLRMALEAQQEIREFAETIGHEIVSKLFPITWQAFLDYRINALTLSEVEVKTLRKFISSKEPNLVDIFPGASERNSFKAKVDRILGK